MTSTDPIQLAEQVRAGNRRAVARLISWLEGADPRGSETLARLEPRGGQSWLVGVTGYPGAGKSSLIDRLITLWRRQGKRVAVLAVDISSRRTGGALLGDRIRMQRHAADPEVFIRSMGTRGAQGGVAAATAAAARVLAAAGYDRVLVETVGMGQDEAQIDQFVDLVMAVVAPGLGDEIQAMKAGLLEAAQVVVVNKADREGADATTRDLEQWLPCVVRTSAESGEGVEDLSARLEELLGARVDRVS